MVFAVDGSHEISRDGIDAVVFVADAVDAVDADVVVFRAVGGGSCSDMAIFGV